MSNFKISSLLIQTLFFLVISCTSSKGYDTEECFVNKFESSNSEIKSYNYTNIDSIELRCYNIQPSGNKEFNNFGWFVFCIEEYEDKNKAKAVFSKILLNRDLKAPGGFLLNGKIIYSIETFCANREAVKPLMDTLISCSNLVDIKYGNIIMIECGGLIVPYE